MTNKFTQRASMHPTSMDVAWAAGFIEGEGTFYLSNRGFPTKTAVVRVGQKEREPLERLLAMFGGRIALRAYRDPTRNAIWQWYVCGARARGVMMTLYGLMYSRRKTQIRNALEIA